MISSFTISDTALSLNTSSVNLEGGPSYIHLDDYIEWNPPGVIPWVFPLDVWTHGYLDFTTVTWKGGSTLRGTRACLIASDVETG